MVHASTTPHLWLCRRPSGNAHSGLPCHAGQVQDVQVTQRTPGRILSSKDEQLAAYKARLRGEWVRADDGLMCVRDSPMTACWSGARGTWSTNQKNIPNKQIRDSLRMREGWSGKLDTDGLFYACCIGIMQVCRLAAPLAYTCTYGLLSARQGRSLVHVYSFSSAGSAPHPSKRTAVKAISGWMVLMDGGSIKACSLIFKTHSATRTQTDDSVCLTPFFA